MAVDAAPDILGMLTLEQMRRADGEFHHFDAALHRAGSVFQRLAVFFTGQLRQFGAMRFEQFAELVQDAAAAQGSRVTPGREGSLGGNDRAFHIFAAGQRHLADHLTACRVGYVHQATAATLDALAVDP